MLPPGESQWVCWWTDGQTDGYQIVWSQLATVTQCLDRVACIAWKRPITRDATRNVICLSVCHTGEPFNWLTDRDAVWGLTYVGPRNHGVEISSREGAICAGCPARWTALEVYVAVYAAKVILQSSIMAWRVMRLFVKNLRPLVIYQCYSLHPVYFIYYLRHVIT